MSGLLFNKIAAGVLTIALVAVGGSEIWRRVSGAGEHGAPTVALPGPEQASAPGTAIAPPPVASMVPAASVGEGAPTDADAAPQPDALPVTGSTPEAGGATAPGAAPAPASEALPLPPPVPAGPDYKALFAAANLEEGKDLAVKCTMCHDMTEANKTLLGPPLYDLFGRDVGSASGFNFSAGPGSLSGVNGAWDAPKLDSFLENPKQLAPNTFMVFAGMKRESERINLMAYIRSLTAGEPAPLE